MIKRFDMKDERLVKKTNEIGAKLYPLILFLSIIEVLLKFNMGRYSIKDNLLVVIALGASILYLCIRSLILRIPLFKTNDICLKEIQNEYRHHSFTICILVYIIGNLICEIFFNEAKLYASFIWFIPLIIYITKSVSSGALCVDNTKAKKQNKNNLKIVTIVASILAGLFFYRDDLFIDGNINIKTLILILVYSLIFGIVYYLLISFFTKKSLKNADKEVNEIISDDI